MNELILARKVSNFLTELVLQGEPVAFLKVHGGPYQRANQPDYFICMCGAFYCLELKHPEQVAVPTAGQSIEQRRWALAGATVITLNDLNAVKIWVQENLAQAKLKQVDTHLQETGK